MLGSTGAQANGVPQFGQNFIPASTAVPHDPHCCVVRAISRVASTSGGRAYCVAGAYPRRGRSFPRSPITSSIGPKIKAPMQMNGSAGIMRLTSPAMVNNVPITTRRTFTRSLRILEWSRVKIDSFPAAGSSTARFRKDARRLEEGGGKSRPHCVVAQNWQHNSYYERPGFPRSMPLRFWKKEKPEKGKPEKEAEEPKEQKERPAAKPAPAETAVKPEPSA